jgi:S-DNA-T family DNA segregation ATPase FtsK/SpoIIIE
MQVKLTVVDGQHDELDIAVTGPPGTTLGELSNLIAGRLQAPGNRMITSNGRPLPNTALLGGPGLRSGCRIRVGTASERSTSSGSVLQARIVGGPDAGRTFSLNRGNYLIGRTGAGADVEIDDPDVSRRHAELVVSLRALSIRDLGSTNGTTIDGSSINDQPIELSLGSLVKIGNSLLSVVTINQPPALVRADEDGSLLVHRPPRIPPAIASTVVEFPVEATIGTRPQVRWLTAMLPTAVAIALALGMHSSQFLAFALLSPATVFASALADRRDWRRGNRSHQNEFAAAEELAQAELDAQLAAEIELRRSYFADPAAVLHTVGTPDCRLWERRPLDASFLQLRLGNADQVAQTTAMRGGEKLATLEAKAVPATVALTNGPLGMAGSLTQVRGTARWLIAQILVCHAPCDVVVVALVDGDCPDWHWLRWPPGVSAVASTHDQRQRVLDELNGLIRQRRTTSALISDRWPGPWTVLLIDPAASVAGLAGFRDVLEYGSAFGITAICVAQDARLLPRSCRSTAIGVHEVGARLELARPGITSLQAVADRVSPEWADEFSRYLAPLADLDADMRALADRVSLIELLHLQGLTAPSVQDRWRRHDGRASCPVGVSTSGPFELDLIRDGPHVLIAGTTGSGKSELLRTMVIGLAASQAPQELAFVLIDYKGGATFAACEELPHTLGVVTDLDAHLTRRALLSLNAELHRREAVFARAGVADLAGYRASAASTTDPLPRLVLIVDEFASLADELPDFLSGLLAIAQRGRSLGVHLVLATQRPAGVVSLDIKANMSLRIALRVTDPGESADVIGDDAACRISRKLPGRALARLADGELVEFQTARIEQAGSEAGKLEISTLDFWNNPSIDPKQASEQDDLQEVCAVIAAAARQYGSCDDAQRPWLAPLPGIVTGLELAAIGNPFEIPFGLTDDPGSQQQFVASLNLAAGGAIGFIGGARSGRTSAIRSLLGHAAGRLNAAQLHLYLIDCAGRGFGQLREIPHCGTVTDRHDPSSIFRLIARLQIELVERQRLLTDAGLGSVAEAHRAGLALPVLIVAVDGWDSLALWSDEYDGGRSADDLTQLIRTGPAAGFTFLITGDRGLLGQRLGSALNRKFLLPMTDRSDYAMAGIDPASLPTQLRAGRVIAAEDGLETQLALLVPDPSPSAQWLALQRLAIPDRPNASGPSIAIRPLPSRVELTELPPTTNIAGQPHGLCLLGLGGDEAATVGCDLFAPHSRFLISGPARSGRSNTAVLIADQARSAGIDLLIAASDWSPLAVWAQAAGYPIVTPDNGRCQLLQPNAGLIVIDDAEQFTDCAVGDQLQARLARHRGAAVVTARSDDLHVSFRGIAVELRKHRTGLLLQPAPADGELLGVRLGPDRIPAITGRGLLVTDRTRPIAPNGLPVQIALSNV